MICRLYFISFRRNASLICFHLARMRGKAQKRKNNNSDCFSCQSKSARNDELKVNVAHNVSCSSHTDETDTVFRSLKDGITPDDNGRISRSTQVDIVS